MEEQRTGNECLGMIYISTENHKYTAKVLLSELYNPPITSSMSSEISEIKLVIIRKVGKDEMTLCKTTWE